jgi:hypothetical protein
MTFLQKNIVFSFLLVELLDGHIIRWFTANIFVELNIVQAIDFLHGFGLHKTLLVRSHKQMDYNLRHSLT